MTDFKWTPEPDGEYNEQWTYINGKKITIASDRDGEKWIMILGEDDAPWDLEATDLHAARREAIKEAITS